MQAPQNLASTRRAPAGRTNNSTRAAVHGIFETTGALLGSFHTELLANARARRKEASGYMNDLHCSVQDMLSDMRQNREEATAATRDALNGYMADLHANVTGALREADKELRQVSRRRRKAAHESAMTRSEEHEALCGNGRQQLQRMAKSRRQATQALHGELTAFAADLVSQTAQARSKFREELGFEEPTPAKAKSSRAQPSQPKARKEEPHKAKGTPRKAKPASSASPVKASPANAKRQAKPTKTAKTDKTGKPAQQKRRVH
jgi:hypothetical protein